MKKSSKKYSEKSTENVDGYDDRYFGSMGMDVEGEMMIFLWLLQIL